MPKNVPMTKISFGGSSSKTKHLKTVEPSAAQSPYGMFGVGRQSSSGAHMPSSMKTYAPKAKIKYPS